MAPSVQLSRRALNLVDHNRIPSVRISRRGGSMSTFARVLSDLQSERKRAENELNRIDNAISALRGLAGGRSAGRNHSTRAARGRRQLSAAARRRISMAQKARWAKYKAMKKAA